MRLINTAGTHDHGVKADSCEERRFGSKIYRLPRVKFLKKLSLSVVNLAIIGAVAWWAWHTYADYVRNPWTRDGQLRAVSPALRLTPSS